MVSRGRSSEGGERGESEESEAVHGEESGAGLFRGENHGAFILIPQLTTHPQTLETSKVASENGLSGILDNHLPASLTISILLEYWSETRGSDGQTTFIIAELSVSQSLCGLCTNVS